MSDEQKNQLESVPLKSDTDAPTTETEEKTEETVVSEPAKPEHPKKAWFFKKSTKKVVETEELNEEKVSDEKEPCKKRCWWRREQKEKSEAEQKADHISIGINLVDRDEKGINDHVKLGFEDIFGEADTAHSWDCIWRLVHKVFTWTRLFVYRLGALIVGLPAAIIFGVLFAILTVINVFACVPLAKLASIPGNWLAKVWNWLVHAVFDPITRSLGLLLSSVTVRKYGINSQPTDLMQA